MTSLKANHLAVFSLEVGSRPPKKEISVGTRNVSRDGCGVREIYELDNAFLGGRNDVLRKSSLFIAPYSDLVQNM